MNIYKIKLVKEEFNSPYDKKITCPSDVANITQSFIADKNDRECFVVVCLSTKNTITGINLVSMGSINSSIVTPSNVFKPAILSNSASIICFHNHPSGDTTPSSNDREVTERLKDAGELIGIELLDHIILGENDFYSMKSKGEF